MKSSGRSHKSASPELKTAPNSAATPLEKVGEELRRQWLAYGFQHDIQTGLLNTQAFQQGVESMLRQAASAQQGVAVVWIDLMNLQREFTLWGWAGADALIRQVAGILRSAADEDALVGHFNHCFVVAMRASRMDAGARRRIQNLVDRMIQPVSGFEMLPDLAAGVAFYPDDTELADELARFACLACAHAADIRSRSVLPFQPGMNSRLMRDHELEIEIDRALEQRQLRMVFQPNINLVTGSLIGAEALMRWDHPKWGEVPPSEFIPIAEKSDLIHRIFEFGLRSALEETQRWQRGGLSLEIIAVNVSPANLRREDFPRRVQRILSEFPIESTVLELEMTESLLLDDEKLFEARLRQLKTLGVRIAIDDFGTRYTGFELLNRLPLDAMKIDRCFIRGIHRSPELRALCTTIVAMGKHLKMRTVAEGIEEPEELAVLQQIGCDAGQGFLFQRPLRSNDFRQFQREWPTRSKEVGFTPAESLSNASLS